LLPGEAITGDVCAKLLLPECGSGFWGCGVAAARVAMPEATVYEDYLATGREYQIRFTGQAGDMKPVAVAQ
jgi:hypothetical protein